LRSSQSWHDPFGLSVTFLEARAGITAFDDQRKASRMDAFDAVAVSMLPASRLRAAATFKELRHQFEHEPDGPATAGHDPLDVVLAACLVPEEERAEAAALGRSRASAALELARTGGIEPIVCSDPRYPPLLWCIPDPPPVLWMRGHPEVLNLPIVSIVGSRAATPYAMDVAYRLGEELAARGIVVASGMARGVDSAGHRGCLAGEGISIAVLGSGLDRVYPPEHEALGHQITCKGCIISELWPLAAPLSEHFPLRNRIISGISLAVVVVEASEKSGSLITARCALEQGREVMAVPGSVLSGRNRGSHSLLKDGAKVVESADDILDGLGWPTLRVPSASESKYLHSDSLLSKMEAGEAYRLDELMELTGVTGTKLLPRLMELELAGLVQNTGSGFSRRLVT
jgi:DNA processing protein